MGTSIGDYIGTTTGIQSPIPYSAPDRIRPQHNLGVCSAFSSDCQSGCFGCFALVARYRELHFPTFTVAKMHEWVDVTSCV